MKISRRKALKSAAAAAPGLLMGQGVGPLRVAGRDVEVTLSSVSAQTVRIEIRPIENGTAVPIPVDGALVENASWPVHSRLRDFEPF